MKKWFSCQIKGTKVDNDGNEAKTTELHIVNAMTYTEAEARIIGMLPQKSGQFFVDKINKVNYWDIISDGMSGTWFRVKVSMVTYNDDTEKEVVSNNFLLIEAEDVVDACKKTTELMKGSIVGYKVPQVSETKVLEVHFFE